MPTHYLFGEISYNLSLRSIHRSISSIAINPLGLMLFYFFFLRFLRSSLSPMASLVATSTLGQFPCYPRVPFDVLLGVFSGLLS